MKKIIGIAVIALSLCALKSDAQIQKGNILVGGDIGGLNFGTGGFST